MKLRSIDRDRSTVASRGLRPALCAAWLCAAPSAASAQDAASARDAASAQDAASARDAGVSAPSVQHTIAPIDPAELAAIRPLLERGPVIIPRAVDQHANSRPTIYARVHAPMAVVHRVVRSPDEYSQFVPALGRVELQGRNGRRTAFRFQATAAIFDVRADVRVNVVHDRRVDVDVTQSDFGPAGSRWEFFSEGPSTTVVALTVWCDPSQATWAIRQFANSSAYSASSANITAETVLALAVKRRAEILAGRSLPVRPSSATNPAPQLVGPSFGPWTSVLRSGLDVVSIELDPQGAMRSLSVARWVSSPEDIVRRRLMEAQYWNQYWLWLQNVRILQQSAERVRISTSLGSPLAPGSGEVEAVLDRSRQTVWIEGRTGDFTRDRQRWDFQSAPGGGTFVMYTGHSDEAHAAWFHRILMDRDVWAVAGLSGYWKVVMIRYGMWAL
jgi:ribosome-associated toxin RatA of RatAB toxin-antitoxin module